MMVPTIIRNQRPRIETFRFWEEYDYEYEIFSMVSSARAWAGVIWAGKRVAVVIPLRVLARVS